MGLIEEPGKVIIITNYVEGLNLYDLLHSDKKVTTSLYLVASYSGITFFFPQIKLSFENKLFIVQQIAQALVFMHTYAPPIIHLDLKPENILVCWYAFSP